MYACRLVLKPTRCEQCPTLKAVYACMYVNIHTYIHTYMSTHSARRLLFKEAFLRQETDMSNRYTYVHTYIYIDTYAYMHANSSQEGCSSRKRTSSRKRRSRTGWSESGSFAAPWTRYTYTYMYTYTDIYDRKVTCSQHPGRCIHTCKCTHIYGGRMACSQRSDEGNTYMHTYI